MIAKQYKIKLTGLTPLLMHRDNIKWGERVVREQTCTYGAKIRLALLTGPQKLPSGD
jgi:hypothetical protein